MILAENITRSFGTLQVLKGIDVTISKGEIVSIVGPSGAGKTTLLQIIGTLSRPTTGNIIIHGTDVSRLKDNELARFRNKHIGFVFQSHHLLPEFTAVENVCIPALIGGASKKETEIRAIELLEYLNLSHRLDHKPAEMSGGEQQRVAIARAIINNPDVLLADEPSGNLDTKNKNDLHALFFSLRERFGQTIIIVTHNDELARMSDRVISLKDGLVVE